MIALGDQPGAPSAVPRFGCARPDLGVFSTAFVSGLISLGAGAGVGRAAGPGRGADARGVAQPLRARARGVLRGLAGERRPHPARARRAHERRRAAHRLPHRRAHPLARRLPSVRGPGLARRADAPLLPRAGGRPLPGAARQARPALDLRRRGRGARGRRGEGVPRRARPRHRRPAGRRGRARGLSRRARRRLPSAARAPGGGRALRRSGSAPIRRPRPPPGGRLAAHMLRLYGLDRQPEIARYHLYRHTYFAAAAGKAGESSRPSAAAALRAAGRERRRGSSSSPSCRPRSGRTRTVARSASWCSRRPGPCRTPRFGARPGGEVLVLSHLAGASGSRFTVREPAGPAEVGRLYRLLSDSGLAAGSVVAPARAARRRGAHRRRDHVARRRRRASPTSRAS